jgi:AcrR family transcriptional regulator
MVFPLFGLDLIERVHLNRVKTGVSMEKAETIAEPARRGRPPRSPAAVEKERGRILRGAEKLFARQGYEGVSMRNVAAAAGCSPAALYTLFPNKRALLATIAEDAFGQLDQALVRATRGGGDSIGKLKRLGIAYVDFWRANPDHFRTLFLIEDRVAPGERYLVDTLESLPKMTARFLVVLEEAVRVRQLSGSPREMLELIFCALHGVASGIIGMPEAQWHKPDAMAERMMEIVLRGFAS